MAEVENLNYCQESFRARNWRITEMTLPVQKRRKITVNRSI